LRTRAIPDSAYAVVIHYEEALYQVYAPLRLLYSRTKQLLLLMPSQRMMIRLSHVQQLLTAERLFRAAAQVLTARGCRLADETVDKLLTHASEICVQKWN